MEHTFVQKIPLVKTTEGSFECKCNRKYIKVMDGDIMKCIGKIPLLIKVELCRFKQYFC